MSNLALTSTRHRLTFPPTTTTNNEHRLDVDQGPSRHLTPLQCPNRLLKMLQHDHLLNPITALEFHHTRTGTLLTLAGEGSFLKIFDTEEARLLHQCEMFSGQTIHGITARDDVDHELGLQVAIWGGSSLTLLSRQAFDQILDQNVSSIADAAFSVPDWILDVAISPFDAASCVLVTAHNTVIRARLGHSRAQTMETLHSPSRSILYSAHLVWESPSCVMVAAGTVFGEIIVWQCSPSDETSSLTSRVLFTFTGHEGSIFGVNISPPIIGLYGFTRLLASCSDDRTIRIWNLSADLTDSHHAAIVVQARETGFGTNGILAESAKFNSSYLAMVMGHASRIWRVRFLTDQAAVVNASAISILSFGEDSTAQQWTLYFETVPQTPSAHSQLSARLDHLHTFAFHSGKHIWSTALHRNGNSRVILATGGADGKISRFEIRAPISPAAVERPSPEITTTPSPSKQASLGDFTWARSWELDEILEGFALGSLVPNTVVQQPIPISLPEKSIETVDGNPMKKPKPKKVPKDSFNRYAFVSENDLLATTTSGRVLLCHIGPKVHWSEVSLPESSPGDLRSYAVLLGFPEMGLVCLAGANGNIYIYRRHQNLIKLGHVEGKVADMFKILDPRQASFGLLVTILGGTKATLFSFDISESQLRLVENAVYSLPAKFVVTSAGRSYGMLVMGSRAGSLALYATTSPESPLQVWTHSGSIPRDAITTITSLPSSNDLGDDGSEYFLTTSRDGFYSIFSTTVFPDVNLAVGPTIVRQVHQGTPPFGPLIERGWFEGGKLFLYGFKGKNFVVWNETEQSEVANVECGGSHRSYAYIPARGSSCGYFVFTKASKMYLYSHRDSSHKIVKAGGHGREIKACAVSEDQSLIATGAEDTTIRIWRYNKISGLQNPLSCQAVIQKHSAGIQHLQWHGSKYLFSSGGNEEFFVWAVEQIPGFGIGIICEATCPNPSDDRDLRIMNFHVTALPSSSSLQTETRQLISLGYSDSTIRSYIYSRCDSFHLACTGRYTSSCLAHIRHFRLADNEINILTAATDGRLALWKGCFNSDLSSKILEPVELAMLSTRRIHQSAIKSLDVVRFHEQILVATGGDDNAIGITVYPASESMANAMPACFILRSAHAAAVTGLCFLHTSDTDSSDGNVKVASSGNDQKFIVWNADLGNDCDGNLSLDIKKIGDAFTPVADVGDVASLGYDEWGKVLVVGNGMEVWKVIR